MNLIDRMIADINSVRETHHSNTNGIDMLILNYLNGKTNKLCYYELHIGTIRGGHSQEWETFKTLLVFTDYDLKKFIKNNTSSSMGYTNHYYIKKGLFGGNHNGLLLKVKKYEISDRVHLGNYIYLKEEI